MSIAFVARSLIAVAYLVALACTGEIEASTVLTASAIAAIWAVPLLRNRQARRAGSTVATVDR